MNASKNCSAVAEVSFISGNALASATNSMNLLRDIEETVNSLSLLQEQFKVNCKSALLVLADIKECNHGGILDPKGELCSSLEETEQALERLHHILTKKRDAAIQAPELKGDHKDSVTAEYLGAITEVACLHNAIADIRWAVGEHDADLEKSDGLAITDPQELLQYLNSL